MDTTRIVVISRDEGIRAHFREMFAADARISVVGEARCGHQGLAAVRHHRPDLVLVDSELPGLSGCAVTAMIKRTYQGAQAILLAPVADFDHLAASMWCGAATALRRDADAATVRRTLEAVLSEQQRFHPWPIPKADEAFADGFVPGQGRLIQRTFTDRQAAVLDCMLMGVTVQQMPDALGTTKYRVRKDMAEMMKALGVKRKLSAITIALERGWTTAGRRPTVVTTVQPADHAIPADGFHDGIHVPEWVSRIGRGDLRAIAT